MKALLIALTLVSGLSAVSKAEVVMNAKESEATFESIKDSAKVLDSTFNGYLKIQSGSTVCYRIPNRAENTVPFTITCVKN